MNKRLVLMAVLLATQTACSLLPNHSLDYRQAKELPPLAATDKTRPINALYPVPTVTPSSTTVALTQGKGRKEKFNIPAPQPLVVNALASAGESEPTGDKVRMAELSKPQLVRDGNGYPLLQVDGDNNRVWDSLQQALATAAITVDDRNQSLGLYFITWTMDGKKANYQLKLTRTASTNVLAMQKDDDTVADAVISEQVFNRLLQHWPTDSNLNRGRRAQHG